MPCEQPYTITLGSTPEVKFHPVWSTFVPGSPKNNILSVVPYSTLQLVCTYVWGLGKINYSLQSGYIVGTYIISD